MSFALFPFPSLPKRQHLEVLSSSLALWSKARSTDQPLPSSLGLVLYSQISLARLLCFATCLGVLSPQFVCLAYLPCFSALTSLVLSSLGIYLESGLRSDTIYVFLPFFTAYTLAVLLELENLLHDLS